MTTHHWLPALHFRAAAPAPDPAWGPELYLASILAAAFFLVLAYSTGRYGETVRTPGRNLARLGVAAAVLTYWLTADYGFDFDENLMTIFPPCSRLSSGASICRDYTVPALPFLFACVTPLAVLAGAWAWQRKHASHRADTPPR